MRESDLLAHIYRRSAGISGDGGVLVGPGDDAAVVRTDRGETLLLTTDQLVGRRHFEPGADVDLIARKAIARSVSDIAAMAGRCRWGVATGAIPRSFADADALFDAMARWARHWSCPLVGGDIAATDGPLLLTATIVGEPATARGPVLRSTAREGDGVYVTGALGDSFASGRHLRFEPRLEEAAWLATTVGDRLHAMMDISDGLGRDAGRVALASGVRIELLAAAIPRAPGARDWRQAASQGEDYELLFTAAGEVDASTPGGTPITRVGEVLPGSGCVVRLEDGTLIDASRLGYDHGA